MFKADCELVMLLDSDEEALVSWPVIVSVLVVIKPESKAYKDEEAFSIVGLMDEGIITAKLDEAELIKADKVETELSI